MARHSSLSTMAQAQHSRGVPHIEPVTEDLVRSALLAALSGSYGDQLSPPSEARPVAHPNGFVKLPLARVARDGRRLFLHMWQAGAADTQIHDHRWDFSSTVLWGTLRNTTVEITDAEGSVSESGPAPAVAYRVVRYRPCKEGYLFDGSDGGRVMVTTEQSSNLVASQQYSMSARTLHRARALVDTATLVARGTPTRPYARVLVRGEVSREPQQWDLVTPEERLDYLRAALDRLR